MTKDAQKEIMLARLRKLANAWFVGDIQQAQDHYQYILGFCNGANLDFNNVLVGGMKYLLNQCVGIKDTAVYNCYLKGIN